jgi:hypothetical protein
MLKKVVKKTQLNQSPIRQDYELVAKDLFAKLKKAKDGAIIKLGNLGAFQKKLSRVTNPYGEVFRYYRISFKISNTLKKELDK